MARKKTETTDMAHSQPKWLQELIVDSQMMDIVMNMKRFSIHEKNIVSALVKAMCSNR